MQRIWMVSLGVLFFPSLIRAESAPSTANLGRKIANVVWLDESGRKTSLYQEKPSRATVIVFLSFECPVSNSYSQPLADLAQIFEKHGVRFVGLTVNEDDSRLQVAKQARDYKIPFPVFLDEKLQTAHALKADYTPECFILDHNYILRYRGRIDNTYSERLKKHAKTTEHDLEHSLQELLAGRPVSQPATQAVGCGIVREEKPTVKTGKVTYYRDVLPILQNHCQSCHRPGEVGPFSLMTYKQAVNWAEDIEEYTRKRIMPPWKLSAGIEYHNDRRMSEQDIAALAAWVAGGCAEGDAKDAPPARTFSEGWQLGTPDLVLTPREEFQLGPTGRDLFRCFVLPTHLPEDIYVSAVEVRPSNPRVVHHVLLFVDSQGKGRQLEKAQQEKAKQKTPPDGADHSGSFLDQGPGYTVSMGVGFVPQGGLGGWAPGNLMKKLPEGTGFFLPRGADVVMQVHFHRNGRTEKDRTQVGLYFARKSDKPYRSYQSSAIAGSTGGIGPFRLFFSIPAGEKNFSLKGDMYAREDFDLIAVTPHMHMLGKSIQVQLTPPSGPGQVLLEIPDWDYNWQESYFLKQPLRIQAGSKLSVQATFDNSDKNPRNPFYPPRRITFGEQTDNEMCFVFLGGLSQRPGRNLPLTPIAPKETP